MKRRHTSSGRLASGQHPSEDKYAVSDGNICILSDVPFPDLRMGERADSLAQIIKNERKGETHFPVPENQIDRSYWMRQIGRYKGRPHGIKISAPIVHSDQMHFSDTGTANSPMEVMGKFDAQLLVDAVDAVGDKPFFFLGYGPFNGHFPSLIVMPPDWTEPNCTKPIALVLPMRT